MLRHFMISVSLSMLVACSDSSTTDPNLRDWLAGADSWGFFENEVSVGEQEIELDSAGQCEITQFAVIASWRNPQDEFFQYPTFRLNLLWSPYEAPSLGDVYDLTGAEGELRWDGIGASSRGASACTAKLIGYYNQGGGKRAGVAIEFENCELLQSGSVETSSGQVHCEGAGFDPIALPRPEEPIVEPTTEDAGPTEEDGGEDDEVDGGDDEEDVVPTCAAELYDPWHQEFESAVRAAEHSFDSDDQERIDGLLASRPCVATHSEAYVVWIDLVDDRIEYYRPTSGSSTLTDGEKSLLERLAMARPAATDVVAHQRWLDVFQKFRNHVYSASSSQITEEEAVILELLAVSQPASTEPEAYANLLNAFHADATDFVSSSSSRLTEEESAVLGYWVHVASPVTDDASFASWLSAYSDRFNAFFPSRLDEAESALLGYYERIRPMAISSASYEAWLAFYGTEISQMSSRIDDTESSVAELLRRQIPAAVEDAAYIAWLALFQSRFEATGSIVSDDEASVLEVYLQAKPCGAGAEAAAAHAAFDATTDNETYVSRSSPGCS